MKFTSSCFINTHIVLLLSHKQGQLCSRMSFPVLREPMLQASEPVIQVFFTYSSSICQCVCEVVGVVLLVRGVVGRKGEGGGFV
jgi:hypothetical protein